MTKNVGVVLPDEIDVCVSLYAAYHDIPKAQAIRQVLLDWIKNSDDFQDQLIYNLVEKIKIEWEDHRKKCRSDARVIPLSKKAFLHQQERKFWKLPSSIVELILQRALS